MSKKSFLSAFHKWNERTERRLIEQIVLLGIITVVCNNTAERVRGERRTDSNIVRYLAKLLFQEAPTLYSTENNHMSMPNLTDVLKQDFRKPVGFFVFSFSLIFLKVSAIEDRAYLVYKHYGVIGSVYNVLYAFKLPDLSMLWEIL